MEKIKKILWVTVSFVVLISTLINIRNQFNTLKLAEIKNDQLKTKLEQMNILGNNLVKKIEYATSSAYIDSQRKQLLGLGTENDYWLDLPKDEDKIEIIREVYETKQESNFNKWLKLFTD